MITGSHSTKSYRKALFPLLIESFETWQMVSHNKKKPTCLRYDWIWHKVNFIPDIVINLFIYEILNDFFIPH